MDRWGNMLKKKHNMGVDYEMEWNDSGCTLVLFVSMALARKARGSDHGPLGHPFPVPRYENTVTPPHDDTCSGIIAFINL